MADNPLFGYANIMGPKENEIFVEDLAAATAEAIDLSLTIPSAVTRMSFISIICDQPFWMKFAVTAGTLIDETVTSGAARCMGPFEANKVHRMRVPGLHQFLHAKSTLASKMRYSESDGEY
jgi:hypothetical protein